jgi:hypothetical protein
LDVFLWRHDMKSNALFKLMLALFTCMCCSNLSAQTTPPVPGGFTTTSSMTAARNWHTATLLNDGTVLIAGGLSTYNVLTSALNTAEIYDTKTGIFTATNGPMNSQHAYHTATLLNNGKVLIAGGVDSTGLTTASAELYDPVAKTFTALSGLVNGRDQHTATLLGDGTVLIAGGFENFVGSLTSAEIYDPTANTFTSIILPGGQPSTLSDPRYGHTATLLNNGMVLFAGGFNVQELNSAELYDPTYQTFTYTHNNFGAQTTMNSPRFLHTATLLNTGQVLIAAGTVNAGVAPMPSNSAELYDPVAETFTYTNDVNNTGNQTTLNLARYFHTATLLNNGLVLIVGGQIDPNGTPTPTAELFDPNAQTFTFTMDNNSNQTNLTNARHVQTSTLLDDGTVLIAGGVVSSQIPAPDPSYLSATATAELYGPLTPSPVTPTISWASPSPITYGAPLGVAQLNATASVPGSAQPIPGTFVYSPALGTVLSAGNQTLSVAFTPTDMTDFIAATTTVTLVVNQATPTLNWTTPSPISYGTPLSSTQLNATASVPGNYAYSQAAGALLTSGSQTLSVTFTPTDATDYTIATATVTLVVNQANPTLNWTTPSAISYGTPLSSTQLNATASVPGNLVYSPAIGAVLLAGSQTLSVTFTPTDTIDYVTANTSVMLTVIGVVTQSPAITSGSSATFTEGAPGSFTLMATGYPVPALTVAGTLPIGITFTDNGNATATLSGTPAPGTAGTYSITFAANNGVGVAAGQTFTLTVNAAPSITSGNSTTFTVGSPGWFTVSAAGGPAPSFSETGRLPAGVTFLDNGNGTATLSGTPATGSGGTYLLTFTASNGIGTAATQTFTLTVNQGSAITSGSATILTVGAAGSFLFSATGDPVPALSESGALPAGITFSDNGNGTAMLSGTPAIGVGGVYPLLFNATNSVATSTQSFTLTVVQGIAVTSGSATTFTVGSQGWFSATATGFPVPALSETGNLPTGVTFTDNGNGTATLTGIPAALTGGTYGITIKATNGGITPDATQSFTLLVNQGAAITTGNSTTFTVGAQGNFTVTATGDPTPALTESGPLPIGINFTDNGNGTGLLTGSPATGTAGSYPITINASNGVSSAAMQSFTLSVNQGPAITSTNSATFNEQLAGSFIVTATGSPAPVLTEVGNLPSGVTFVDNGNGSATLSGTPAAGSGGLYGFTITASNGVAPNATQSFTLGVGQPAAITSPNSTTFIAGTAGSFTVTASGIPAPALSESGTLPSGVLFNAGVLSGTPAAGTGGTYSISFTAHNGVGPDTTQNFTLTVDEAPSITSATVVKFGAGAHVGFYVTATGFPSPALTETGLLPVGVTFTDYGIGLATLGGIPATGSEGTYVISFTASNGVGHPTVQNFTLTVYGESGPAFTSANHITVTSNNSLSPGGVQRNTFTVTTTGFPTPVLTCKNGCSGATGGTAGNVITTISFHDNGNGTATWIFDAAAPGIYLVPITATGAGGVAFAVVQVVTVTVVAPKLPAITSVNHTVFTYGVNDSFTITTTGAPTPVLQATQTIAGVVQPLQSFWFTDNGNGTATLKGPWGIGLHTFQITATGVGGAAHAATQTFSLEVVPANESGPIFTSANHITVTSNNSLSPGGVQRNTFTVTTTGFPTPVLTCKNGCSGATGGTAGNVITTISFHDNGNGTATWIFDAAVPGIYQVPITATGAGGAAFAVVQVVTVTVVAPKLPAITSVNHVVFTLGTFGSFTVTTTGSPAPVLTYAHTSTGPPVDGLTFTDNGNGTATLSGSPCISTGFIGCGASNTPSVYLITATGAGGAAHAATQTFSLLVVPPAP